MYCLRSASSASVPSRALPTAQPKGIVAGSGKRPIPRIFEQILLQSRSRVLQVQIQHLLQSYIHSQLQLHSIHQRAATGKTVSSEFVELLLVKAAKPCEQRAGTSARSGLFSACVHTGRKRWLDVGHSGDHSDLYIAQRFITCSNQR
jgi:hypothetical protein